jgi:hypothetical protein
VNYFGHAAVATWASDATPAFVLGAMLPDFAAISGARSVGATHHETARGVLLHHATDEVFHAAPDFVALTRLVRERLERGGVGRGGAWAAAHVGIELLIDGTLVTDGRACALYVRALRDADAHMACADIDEGPSLARFLDRVRGAGVPYPYADPRAVAARVERALLSRPRLALHGGQADVLAAVLADVAADVRERARSLLDEVRRGLLARMAGPERWATPSPAASGPTGAPARRRPRPGAR